MRLQFFLLSFEMQEQRFGLRELLKDASRDEEDESPCIGMKSVRSAAGMRARDPKGRS